MSKIKLIPEGIGIHMDSCDDNTFCAVYLYSDEYQDWFDKNPDVELECTIEYPLTNPCTFKIPSTSYIGDIIEEIINKYIDIYNEEADTTDVQEDEVEGTYNRNKTTGKYGIWGHDFDDLIIEDLCLDTETNKIELIVCS